MILQMYSVYDKAVNAYLQPFFCRAKGEALRSFTDACNKNGENFNKYSSDYTLVFLGEWDDAAGVFNARDPVRVISASECLMDDPFKSETKAS